MNIRSKTAVPVLATVSCLLWGSAFPALKIGNQILGLTDKPYTYQILFAGYRFFLAGLLTLIIARCFSLDLRLKPRDWNPILRLGLIQTAVQYVLFYVGLFNTTGINGSIITASGTFFAIILAHFHYANDRLSARKWAGLAVGFLGVLLPNLNQLMHLRFNWLGDGLIMLSAFFGAWSLIFAKKVSSHMDPVVASGYQMVFGASALVLIGFCTAGPTAITFTPAGAAVLGYLAFLSSAAFALWYLLLKHHKVSQISINKFQIPVWGVLLSAALIPGEHLKPVAVAALLAVVAGIRIVYSEKS